MGKSKPPFLARLGVETLTNLPCTCGATAGTLTRVRCRGPLYLLQCPEMKQQGTLARRPDTRDFLQAGLADVLLAQLAVRADHKAVRLVAEPLDEIKDRIARFELDGLAAGDEQGLAAGGAVRAFGNAQERDLGDAKLVENLLC